MSYYLFLLLVASACLPALFKSADDNALGSMHILVHPNAHTRGCSACSTFSCHHYHIVIYSPVLIPSLPTTRALKGNFGQQCANPSGLRASSILHGRSTVGYPALIASATSRFQVARALAHTKRLPCARNVEASKQLTASVSSVCM